jgi:hypothetical protein
LLQDLLPSQPQPAHQVYAGRHLTDVYPVTAGLGIISYAQGAYNPAIGCISLILMILVTAILIFYTPDYDKIMSSVLKDSTKQKETTKGMV